MKKIFYILCVAVSCGMIMSCSKSDDGSDSPEQNVPDYTVMFYGCGGGDLDSYMVNNVKQCLAHGKTDNMNMTFLLKMSKGLKDSVDVGTMKGTVRFALGEKQDTTGMDFYKYPTEKIGGDDYPLYKSENLTEFIKWNVENYPAKNYILVLWNHGEGWIPEDTLTQIPETTRTILMDDNVDDKALTLEQTTLGVKNSGVHLKALITDACLMAMYENLGEYATVADYHVGSVETTPGLGSRYDWLLDAISGAQNNDEKLWENVKGYCDKLCDYWKTNCPLDPLYVEGEELSDMGIVNLNKIDTAYPIIKEISEELVASDAQYHDVYISAKPKRIDYFFYDSKTYFEQLAEKSGNERLKSLSEQYNKALDTFMYRSVVHTDKETTPRDITISFAIVNNEYYKEFKFDKSYEYLLFDQATKWSNWLKKNDGDM